MGKGCYWGKNEGFQSTVLINMLITDLLIKTLMIFVRRTLICGNLLIEYLWFVIASDKQS